MMKRNQYIFLIAIIVLIVVILSGCSKEESLTIGGYEIGDYEKYNSSSNQDRLKGDKMYIYGTCTDIETRNGVKFCFLENKDEEWMVGLWDTDTYGDKDFDFLIGEEIYVFGMYSVYSKKDDMPMIIFETIVCDEVTYDLERLVNAIYISAAQQPVEVIEGAVRFNEFIKTFDYELKSSASRKGYKVPNNCEFIEEESGKYYANVVFEDIVGMITIYVDKNGYITEGYFVCDREVFIEPILRQKTMESCFREGFGISSYDDELDTWYEAGAYKYMTTEKGMTVYVGVKLK